MRYIYYYHNFENAIVKLVNVSQVLISHRKTRLITVIMSTARMIEMLSQLFVIVTQATFILIVP